MKNSFYGVYGTNGAGLYTHWAKVMDTKPYVHKFRVKKFDNPFDAIKFIIDGVSVFYPDAREWDKGQFFTHHNWFWYFRDLELK